MGTTSKTSGIESEKEELENALADITGKLRELGQHTPDLGKLIEEVNRTWCKVIVGSEVRFLREKIQTTNGVPQRHLKFFLERNFYLALSETSILLPDRQGRLIKKPIAPIWIHDPRNRRYEDVGMFPPPLQVPDNTLNLWAGWGVPPRAGSWERIEQHIVEVCAGGNQRHADYILDWIAYGMQHLDEKLQAAILLIGGQGLGKGTLGHLLRRCYGMQSYYINNTDQLVGRFNAHLADKLFAFVDEAIFAPDRSIVGSLKSLITEPEHTIEPKFVDKFSVPNRLRFLFASNEDYAMALDEDDRRVAAFEVRKTWQSERAKKSYFDVLRAEIYQHRGAEAFLFDMLRRDVSDFNIIDIPPTEIRNRQKTSSLRGAKAWWFDRLCAGEAPWFPPARGLSAEEQLRAEVIISKAFFYNDYIEWTKQRRSEYPESVESFWRHLRTLADIVDIRPHLEGARQRAVVIPPLALAREQFATAIKAGGMLTWPDTNAGPSTDTLNDPETKEVGRIRLRLVKA